LLGVGAEQGGENRRAGAWERHLSVPVLLAALLAVPAVLLAQWGEGNAARIGSAVNWASGIVLWGEWLLLIALADNKRAWLRAHRWSAVIAAATLPAVLLLLGPVQILRLVLSIGSLPVTRLTRIAESGAVIRRRLGLDGRWGTAIIVAALLLTVATAALLLIDPTSESRVLLASLDNRWDAWRLALSGLILTGAVVVSVVLYRRRSTPL
jgi:CsoR family transcriptional regulator, copper-sensing transcriptional repressor